MIAARLVARYLVILSCLSAATEGGIRSSLPNLECPALLAGPCGQERLVSMIIFLNSPFPTGLHRAHLCGVLRGAILDCEGRSSSARREAGAAAHAAALPDQSLCLPRAGKLQGEPAYHEVSKQHTGQRRRPRVSNFSDDTRDFCSMLARLCS